MYGIANLAAHGHPQPNRLTISHTQDFQCDVRSTTGLAGLSDADEG